MEKAAGMSGTQEKGAKQMFQSIKRFGELPSYVQLWPGHGAGSACGKSLGAVPSSTVGYEKIRNWAFQFDDDQEGFVSYLLEDQPEPPTYFATMKRLNKETRPLLVEIPQHPKLTNAKFKSAYQNGVTVIDTRNKSDFGKGFLPGSLNIQDNNSFATWAGWLLNYQEQFVLVAKEAQMEELTRKLMRIGLDNMYGFIENVDDLGIELSQSELVTIEEFKTYLGQERVQVVDVRGETEFKNGHIQGVEHIFVGTMEKNLHKIIKDKQVVIHCQSGDRAAIANSILQKHGFKHVKTFSGGMKEWLEKDNPVVKNIAS